MFNFLKINDPFLGAGTFGQLARFGPERCAVMHLHLSELENGGWKKKEEFEQYIKAYNASSKGVKKYLDNAIDVFFQRYRIIFDRHMVTKWTSSEIVPYVLGGDPHHAREFARWLVYHESHPDDNLSSTTPSRSTPSMKLDRTPSTPPTSNSYHSGSTHSSAERFTTPSPGTRSCTSTSSSNDTESYNRFKFSRRTCTLGKHHTMDRENKDDIKIKLQDSMEFLTQYADPATILKDKIVSKNWRYIVAMSESKEAVDLFCKTEDGHWDKESWNGMDYEPFVNDIIRQICIHSSHQQRCENYVQLCGLLSMTGVGEVRRTCRAIINSIINRRFNGWAIEESNKRRKTEDQNPVKRVKIKEKVALYLEFIDDFFEKCDKGMAAAPPGLVEKVEARLAGTASKTSTREQDESVAMFELALGKKPKYTKTQEAKGIERTAHTEGAVFLRILSRPNNSYLKKYGLNVDGIINAEMRERGINFSTKTAITAKKKALKKHEYQRRVGEDEDWTKTDVQYIVPQSEMLKLFLKDHQGRILNAQHETEALEDDE